MVYLYDTFRRHPNSSVDIRELEESCGTSPEEMNWNLIYLEKCEYIELGKSVLFPPYVATMITLTVKGIDLVEDAEALKKRFGIP
ncbi:MAG: hypothetical protein AB1724_00575 [Thermodesulfobacteriota bacterium]